MKHPTKITIDLSVYIPPFLNFLKETCTIKYIYTWVNIYYNFYVAFEKATERWRKALDKSNLAGALLTDISKAFDSLNHGLLIAKLEAYGFDHKSISYIHSYLSGRKQ